ncbi:MAG TPA: DUF4845 domain-containing protein [Acidobacteriota bacterium]|nr:DUF4845 domain-containing protein [Acidobacteriota bacterium]
MRPKIHPVLHYEDGKGLTGCLIIMLLMGAAVFLTVQLGPAYYARYSMETEVKTVASRAGARFMDDDAIMRDIMDLAKKNNIPLGKGNVRVRRLAGQLQIDVNYTVPVNLLFFQYDKAFSIQASSFIGTI